MLRNAAFASSVVASPHRLAPQETRVGEPRQHPGEGRLMEAARRPERRRGPRSGTRGGHGFGRLAWRSHRRGPHLAVGAGAVIARLVGAGTVWGLLAVPGRC